MNRFLIKVIALLLCIISFKLYAQQNDDNWFWGYRTKTTRHTQQDIKIFTGYNLSWSDNVDFKDSKGGFLIGLSSTIPIANYIAIEPGIKYIQKTNKINTGAWSSWHGFYFKEHTYHLVDPFFKTKLVARIIPIDPFIGFSMTFNVGDTPDYYQGNVDHSGYRDLPFNFLFGADYVLQNRYVFNIEYNHELFSIPKVLGSRDIPFGFRSLIFSFGYLF